MAIETEPFDPAKYIRNEEDAVLFLNDAMDSGDPAVVAAALEAIARAHGASGSGHAIKGIGRGAIATQAEELARDSRQCG